MRTTAIPACFTKMVKLPKITIALCGLLGAYVGKQLAWTPPASVAALRALAPPLQLACGALTVLLAYVAVALFCAAVYETDPLETTLALFGSFASHEKKRGVKVDSFIDEYNSLQTGDSKSDVDGRNSKYATLVNAYYELATMFYEWGWGSSFHFAYRWKGESFADSIRRHEWYLAGRLGVAPDAKVLDVGCGIGGPYRNIAKFTRADITGITINEYQVQRANELNAKMGLADQVRSVQGDFMELPFGGDAFDAVYAIEATCHAPDRNGVYGEIYRVLKPGAVFACYEWCLTDEYDKKDASHKKIKKAIEEGDGLPDMCHTSAVDKAIKKAGFELLESRDVALDENPGGITWYQPLTPSWNVLSQRFQFTGFGMWLTTNLLWVLEKCRLAPAGTSKVQTMLQQGGIGCAQGGITGTFTPMYLIVARKPFDAPPAKGSAKKGGRARASR